MASKELTPNKKLLIIAAIFLAVFFTPFTHPRVAGAIQEAFLMLADYAHEHVLLCVVPAMLLSPAFYYHKKGNYNRFVLQYRVNGIRINPD